MMNLSSDLENRYVAYELKTFEEVVTLRHVPRRTAYIVFFALAAYTLNWQFALQLAAITWFVLFLIFQPGLCRKLKGTNLASWSEMAYCGLRWIVALVCTGIIWYRTAAVGWDGWWPLISVVLLDAFATIALDSRELAYVRLQIAQIYGRQAIEPERT
jgi:sterol desaturase/sphingolipid hydroxylase (fatty acid hydroxylase superfamily)